MCLSYLLSNSDNSSMGVARVEPASAAVAPLASICSSPCPLAACVAGAVHARRTVSRMHDAYELNSWSDTVSSQGPRGRKRGKEGVTGPAGDLRPVSEVEAGVNVRPAGGVRGQVAGTLLGRQPGTGTMRRREGAVTPSLHPEVPGTRFASPGRGLGIRQSMGWTKVCETARSGIWVLKGNARTCMLPINLDHLRVGWILGDHTRPPGLRQGTTVCVHTSMDVEQLSDHKLITPSAMGSHHSCHPGVQEEMCQRE